MPHNPHMQQGQNHDHAREMARDLLRAPVKLVSDRFEGIRTVGVEVRDALDHDYIPRLLFVEIAPDAELRREAFGNSTGDTPIEFELSGLRRALRFLADTGLRDIGRLRDGEDVLGRLIRGVRAHEERQKQGIAPGEATDNALARKALHQIGRDARRGEPAGMAGGDLPEMIGRMIERMRVEGEDRISPDELDESQQAALSCYQSSRHCRIALEQILAGLKAINEELEREGPKKGGGSWELGRT